jgi:hypothetical protein
MPLNSMGSINNYGDWNSSGFAPSVKKGIYTGIISTLACQFLLGDGSQPDLNFLNMDVSASLGVGLASAAGSVAGDYISDYVVGQMDQSMVIKSYEKTLINACISGVCTVGALDVAAGVPPNLMGFGVGAVSSVAGNAVYGSYDQMLLGQIF